MLEGLFGSRRIVGRCVGRIIPRGTAELRELLLVAAAHVFGPGAVGALVQFGTHSLAVSILAGVAIVLASINIVGGFAVTRRMLAMFSRS